MRWSLKGREVFGFLSPSHRACKVRFDAFEKMKCIFSITPMESLENLRENAGLRGPDAAPACLVRSRF